MALEEWQDLKFYFLFLSMFPYQNVNIVQLYTKDVHA